MEAFRPRRNAFSASSAIQPPSSTRRRVTFATTTIVDGLIPSGTIPALSLPTNTGNPLIDNSSAYPVSTRPMVDGVGASAITTTAGSSDAFNFLSAWEDNRPNVTAVASLDTLRHLAIGDRTIDEMHSILNNVPVNILRDNQVNMQNYYNALQRDIPNHPHIGSISTYINLANARITMNNAINTLEQPN